MSAAWKTRGSASLSSPGVHFSQESVYRDAHTHGSTVTTQDTQAFVSEIYRSHNQRLLGFLAHRVRNASLHASDLAQEVYLRLSRISRPQTIREPQAYLFRVARNVIYDHEIGLGSLPATVALSDSGNDIDKEAGIDLATQLERRQRLERIEALLGDLPPRPRAIFTLHRAYGHTLDELAAQFGVSRSQIKKDFAKAVMHLNQRLREEA